MTVPPNLPEHFNHPAPPERYYPQDFFMYAPPEQLHGLQVPLIGEIWSEPPWILRHVDGVGSTTLEAQMQKLPFMEGEELLNTDPQPRVISMTIRIIGAPVMANGEEFTARQNLFFLRNLLAQAFFVAPVDMPRPGERPRMGRLLYFREDWPRVELPVIPRDSPQFTTIPGVEHACDADIEFVAPDPYWRDMEFSTHRFDPEPGDLQYPMEHPFEFHAFAAAETVHNAGDVRTPIIARFYGPIGSEGFVRLRNETISREIEVAGPVAEGEYIEVNTAFGEKTVELVDIDSGERENVMHRLGFETSDFWQLVRGENQVSFHADEFGESTRAVIRWKNRYAGV